MSLERHLRTHVEELLGDKVDSLSVRLKIENAITKMKIASADNYETISALSLHWDSDDTGSKLDSDLFIETISKLHCAKTKLETDIRILGNNESIFSLVGEIINRAKSMTALRKLFVLHYAGHGAPSNNASHLIITSTICNEPLATAPHLNMSYIKESLRELASTTSGLDILLILDCCCAATAGRGATQIVGERLELMAATSSRGLSNSRLDGITFTQSWCVAFETLFNRGKSFTCDDIHLCITKEQELEQFPGLFVLREGWKVPISFHSSANSISSPSFPFASGTQSFVVTAFHLVESPDSRALQELVAYLEHSPVQISVIAALPISSTLLVLRVPRYFQEALVLPRLVIF